MYAFAPRVLIVGISRELRLRITVFTKCGGAQGGCVSSRRIPWTQQIRTDEFLLKPGTSLKFFDILMRSADNIAELAAITRETPFGKRKKGWTSNKFWMDTTV